MWKYVRGTVCRECMEPGSKEPAFKTVFFSWFGAVAETWFYCIYKVNAAIWPISCMLLGFYLLWICVLAERAEMIAYNALPATFTKDMWAHQYLQQPNEMNAIHSDDHVWTHDGPDSTLYGLAPNYGCCTGTFYYSRLG